MVDEPYLVVHLQFETNITKHKKYTIRQALASLSLMASGSPLYIQMHGITHSSYIQ